MELNEDHSDGTEGCAQPLSLHVHPEQPVHSAQSSGEETTPQAVPGSSCLALKHPSCTLEMVISVQVSYYGCQQCLPASTEGHCEILQH